MKDFLSYLRKQRQEQVRTAQEDGRIKRKNEEIFKREILSLFSLMVRDFRARYAANGAITPTEEFLDDWTAALKKHYRRMQRNFKNRVINRIDLDENIITIQELEELTLVAFLNWMNEAAPRQAEIINRTSLNQMRQSIQDALRISREQDLPTDNRSIGALVGALLTRRYKGRVSGIAMYETQQSAEKIKNIEANTASENIRSRRPGVIVAPDTKIWITMRDNLVRASHVLMDGVAIPIDQTFNINGSQLMFPGDGSLGAALKEIINCRCSLIYEIRGRI